MGYTMLTYPYLASNEGGDNKLASAPSIVRLGQNPKEPQQPQRDFVNLVVGKGPVEFGFVYGAELGDGLPAQLLWRSHASYNTRATQSRKG